MENYLKETLVTLADAGVEFAVGGGVACVLHGVERVTLDLDVAVQIARSMVTEKGALVFSLADFNNPLRHLIFS
jgi:hypothetical protein